MTKLIEQKIEIGETLYLTFIDLRAAFDTVNRKIIWELLKTLHVPNQLVLILGSVYKTVKRKVQRSQKVSMRRGIEQEDSLSRSFFIIEME